MNINNISEQNIEALISSLKVNPNIEGWDKEELLKWLRLQLKEQKIGGAWKRRIRESGCVI
jgi:hypothetical protein